MMVDVATDGFQRTFENLRANPRPCFKPEPYPKLETKPKSETNLTPAPMSLRVCSEALTLTLTLTPIAQGVLRCPHEGRARQPTLRGGGGASHTYPELDIYPLPSGLGSGLALQPIPCHQAIRLVGLKAIPIGLGVRGRARDRVRVPSGH